MTEFTPGEPDTWTWPDAYGDEPMDMPTMVNVLSTQTVRIECVGEACAVTATGSQWVAFRDECNRLRAAFDKAGEDPSSWADMCGENERLEAENERFRGEVGSVLMLMDQLAAVWGDEGVFRRCRDRLRALLAKGEAP